MNIENVTSYLKDHLAGSVAAVELLDHLAAAASGERQAFFETLKVEIQEDQKALRDLLGRLGVEESSFKKAGAWLAEKALHAKVSTGDGDLGDLEALEVLVLGIEGKLRLWAALECLDTGLNLPYLQAAARSQIGKVEALRLQAAARAFKNA